MKKEKIYNLLLFILIFFTILSTIILYPLNNLDELWNYNFARNIADGLVPYKDFNMLQMPLLPIICGIILKIIANELIVMRVLAALLCSLITYMTYKLFNIIDIKKEFSIILTFIILYMLIDVFCIDYNFATLLLVLIIIYKEIKYYKKDNNFIKNNLKEEIFLGGLAGLTIALKQTTGLFICIAALGNKLLFVKNKGDFKIFLKSFIYRLIGIMIPILLMLIYLIVHNALGDFINYTIKGVSGFSNYISYKTLIKWNFVGVLSVVVPIVFIFVWIRTVILEKEKVLYVFLVYGLAIFIVCFPISDKIHFLIGAFPTIIMLLYKIYKILCKICAKIFKNNKINYLLINFILAFTVLISTYFNVKNLYNYFNNLEYTSKLNHFKYIPISSELEKEIKKVDNYIQNNEDVKILDANAAIYMIPIDKYNKNYDMLLKGNLGFNGESKIIEEIKESTNVKYLILEDKFYKNWQTPMDIINFVLENKTKVGEIEMFDIYE